MTHHATKGPVCRIGTSGYHYDHWRKAFYPEALKKEAWFDYYTKHFDTVEINNTFYRLPEAKTFEAWQKRAPDGFLYALKFSRYGSHMKKLKDSVSTIGQFCHRIQPLKASAGPILVQLPPRWHPNPERLSAFLENAPRNLRWAVEFRNPEWLSETVYDVLRTHGAALCIHDMLADHPRLLTAKWTYVRFHGDHYEGSYSYQALSAWARWMQEQMSAGRDVYAYFNNDAEGHAVRNAQRLKRYVFG